MSVQRFAIQDDSVLPSLIVFPESGALINFSYPDTQSTTITIGNDVLLEKATGSMIII